MKFCNQYVLHPDDGKYVVDVFFDSNVMAIGYELSDKINKFHGLVGIHDIITIECDRLWANMIDNKGLITTKPIRLYNYDSDGVLKLNFLFQDIFLNTIIGIFEKKVSPLLTSYSTKPKYITSPLNSLYMNYDDRLKSFSKKVKLVKDPVMYKLENPDDIIYEVTSNNIHQSLHYFNVGYNIYE